MTELPEGAVPARVDLRSVLSGETPPDFVMILPPGWERRAVTDAEQSKLERQLRTRLFEMHRPELYAQMRGLVKEAFEQMRKVSTVAMFGPGEDAPETSYYPASLTASIQHAEPGETLDGYVQAAIQNNGATPLLGDQRFLRLETDRPHTMDGEQIQLNTVAYLTPVPGSQRRRALLLTLVIFRPLDVPLDDPPLIQLRTLFDLCVSTLAWVPGKGGDD